MSIQWLKLITLKGIKYKRYDVTIYLIEENKTDFLGIGQFQIPMLSLFYKDYSRLYLEETVMRILAEDYQKSITEYNLPLTNPTSRFILQTVWASYPD